MIIVCVVKHETWPPMCKRNPRLRSHTVYCISSVVLCEHQRRSCKSLSHSWISEWSRSEVTWQHSCKFNTCSCFFSISSCCCWPHTKLPAGRFSWRRPGETAHLRVVTGWMQVWWLWWVSHPPCATEESFCLSEMVVVTSQILIRLIWKWPYDSW